MRNKTGLKTWPISALVASHNEAHLLEDCLKSIQFCDEIFFVDLGSSDNSTEVATPWVDKVVKHHKVPIIEAIHADFVPQLQNDWFLLIDPDERISVELQNSIAETLQTVDSHISVIRAPMFNFFKGKKLEGTYFGGLVYARCLYRRSGVNLSNDVHANIQMKDGFQRIKIKFEGRNYNSHYWCNSWAQLLDKHRRYLNGEGEAQYNQGLRYSLKQQWKDSLIRFYYSFKTRQGYKDGWRGLMLSFLAARYEFLKWHKLKQYQKLIK